MPEDWLERYAAALDLPPLSGSEVERLLDLARDVAHGSERRNAPLSTFLAGVVAGRSGDRDGAIDAAAGAARELTADA